MEKRVTEFSASEAKNRFSELLARAERGEEVTITRHGKPVARLMQTHPTTSLDERMKAIDAWIKYRDEHKLTLGPDLTIQQLITEGRKY